MLTPSRDDQASEDRRRFPRVREDCVVRFRRIDATSFFGPLREGITHNISGGGICFETREDLHIGDPVALDLRLPEFGSTVLALGRVVRLEPLPASTEAAVEFWWVGWADDDAQRAIADYIRTRLRDEAR